jgi:hypothetical protein
MSDVAENIAEADMHARTHPRPRGVVPHSVRCNWMCEGERCRKVDGHRGEHEFAPSS